MSNLKKGKIFVKYSVLGLKKKIKTHFVYVFEIQEASLHLPASYISDVVLKIH